MKRTRYIVAVALVATALCADRVATAAPTAHARPQVAQLANRLVMRLTVSFRRLVPATRVYEVRRAAAAAPVRPAIPTARPVVVPQPSSPFEYRLPPPTC